MAIQFHRKKKTAIRATFRSLRSNLLHFNLKHRLLKTQNRRVLNFFRKKLRFTKPSSILLDGSFIIHCLKNNLPLRNLRYVLDDQNLDLYTTKCVKDECKLFLSKFYGSKKLPNLKKILDKILVKRCDHRESVQSLDCIKQIVGDNNTFKFFFATLNSHMFENPGLPIVAINEGFFVIKNPSRYQQRNSEQLCLKLSLAGREIIEDDVDLPMDDPNSPEFQRLLARLQLYKFAKIRVVGDGNCLHRALSEQLTHSESSHTLVRHQITQQLMQNKPMYETIVSEFLASLQEVDPDMSELTYDQYVSRLSQDRGSGDYVCIQAAADLFKAKIVCLCSFESLAILEFYPKEKKAFERVLYLALLIRVHADSMYPLCTPVSMCTHLYPL